MIAAVEATFIWAVAGRAQSPPVMHIAVAEHRGDVDVKSAYISGEDHFAVKIAAGFYGNSKLGLPTGSGLVVLIDSRTGRPDMVFLDNGYLTDMRTAAAGAIAVKHLGRPQDRNIGIIGCGAQARFQLRAIAVEQELQEVRVASRSPEKVAQYAEEMSRELALPVVATSIDDLVASSDIIVTTTPSTSAVLQGDMLGPGQTVVAMGSDAPRKRELDAAAFACAALVVCDDRRQCEILGELHHAIETKAIRSDLPIIELGEVSSGKRKGRTGDRDIVICDLTGIGAQDSAIGLYARRGVIEKRGAH